MMNFIETNEYNNDRYLSPVAMIFNGVLIEDVIDDYQTLTVAGRETLSYDVELNKDNQGLDGAILLDKRLPERYLTVRYKLIAKTDDGLQAKFRVLNALLDTDNDVEIKFRDDSDIMFKGQVAEMGEIPTDRNNVISDFKILCSDPYKYDSMGSTKGNPLTVFIKSPMAVNPDEIKITLKSDTENIRVSNQSTGRRILLAGDYKKNDEIVIKIKENEITRNGQIITQELVYNETDFHAFKVKTGDSVAVNPSDSELELKARGRWK